MRQAEVYVETPATAVSCMLNCLEGAKVGSAQGD
jgi:hypothetical protein